MRANTRYHRGQIPVSLKREIAKLSSMGLDEEEISYIIYMKSRQESRGKFD